MDSTGEEITDKPPAPTTVLSKDEGAKGNATEFEDQVHHAPTGQDVILDFEDDSKKLFDEMVDSEGHITKDDVERHWQKQGKNPTPDNVNEVLNKVDLKNKEGTTIKFDEFVEIEKEAKHHRFYTCDPKDDLEEALKFFDKNDDGNIDMEELRDILSGYDDAELEDLIKAADTDGNGSLSIEEISKYLMENLGIDASTFTGGQ